jgi:glycosyltransferase involved in cell wall biosynthesis
VREAADVSVVIPAYNAERFVEQAIQSALQQSLPPREILVVDDGSQDRTRERARAAGSIVGVLSQANAGVSVARNTGILQASGRYVAFLDADDMWLPEKLERQLATLADDTRCRAAYSFHVAVDDDLQPIETVRAPRRADTISDLLMIGNVVGTPSSVICERALLVELGGFDPALSLCADWDMWLRVAARGEFICVSEPLVRYRRHESNMSRDVDLLASDSRKTLGKAFADPGLPAELAARRGASLGRNEMVLAGSYLRAGRTREAARCAWRALVLDPGALKMALGLPLRTLRRRSTTRTNSRL